MVNSKITPTISTLRAELRIIQIGNKQMTFGVFNQLYEDVCFDDQFNVVQQLWGKVLHKNETWIIFQIGSDLRKMNLRDVVSRYVITLEDYINGLPNEMMWPDRKWSYLKELMLNTPNSVENIGAGLHIGSMSYTNGKTKYYWYNKNVSSIVELLKNRLGEQVFDGFMEEFISIKQKNEKSKQLYEKLDALDQLFIAV